MTEANVEQRAHWDEIVAPRWIERSDELDAELAPIAELVLKLAAPRAGESVLEIGSGTGSMAVRLARAVTPGGHVLGVDISRPMTEAARARVRRERQDNVAFRVADAQTAPLPPQTFDLAFSRFGVMFFADPVAAFANIRLAMKAEGRLAFNCWGPLERNPLWAIPCAVVARHLGGPTPRAPHAPGPMAFDDPDYVRDVLSRAGWRAIEIKEAAPPVLDRPLDRATESAVTMGPAAALIRERQAGTTTIAKIRDEIAAEWAPFVSGGRVHLAGSIYLVAARA